MNMNLIIRRAQIYSFLVDALVYPTENWLEDLPDLSPILADLRLSNLQPSTNRSPVSPPPDLWVDRLLVLRDRAGHAQ